MRFRSIFILAIPFLLIASHVWGYESRARMYFEPLPDQSGIMSAPLEPGQPLWFKDMRAAHSTISVVKAGEVDTCGSDKHVCVDVDVNMQHSAWPGQSDHYSIRLTMAEPEQKAGPFTITWSPDLKPIVVWNADERSRGIRTNQSEVTEAKMH